MKGLFLAASGGMEGAFEMGRKAWVGNRRVEFRVRFLGGWGREDP